MSSTGCCDAATVSPAGNFEELITRYSPGTLDHLPQVAVAWLGNDQHNYLAMTIHRAPGKGLYDASGRKVVLTHCFCVPFHELAAGPVSYQAMYEAFRREQLLAVGEDGIKVDLPVMSPLDPGRRMPMLVANLLLTDIPVCILGADRVDLDTRLAFLDSVMALLPYGMRAKLSASTWTNSIFEEHKGFRLFFTSARRQAEGARADLGSGPRGVHQPRFARLPALAQHRHSGQDGPASYADQSRPASRRSTSTR